MGNLIYDCDPGLDDAIALIALSALTSDTAITITTSYGNASVAETTKNALAMTWLLGQEARFRVLRGSAHPQASPSFVAGGGFNDDDGFCSLRSDGELFAHPNLQPAGELVEAVPALLNEGTTVIATAPLTNLASLLQPIGASVEVYTLGAYAGLRPVSSPRLSYNIRLDREAARAVFAADVPLRCTGLDIYGRWRDEQFAPLLSCVERSASPVARFIERAMAAYRARGLSCSSLFVDSLPVFAYCEPDLFAWVRGQMEFCESETGADSLRFVPGLGTTSVATEVDVSRLLRKWEQILA